MTEIVTMTEARIAIETVIEIGGGIALKDEGLKTMTRETETTESAIKIEIEAGVIVKVMMDDTDMEETMTGAGVTQRDLIVKTRLINILIQRTRPMSKSLEGVDLKTFSAKIQKKSAKTADRLKNLTKTRS